MCMRSGVRGLGNSHFHGFSLASPGLLEALGGGGAPRTTILKRKDRVCDHVVGKVALKLHDRERLFVGLP